MQDFTEISYLKIGNHRQQLAYKELVDLRILEILKDYQPILVGTVPLGIDLPESDLDLICCCAEPEIFSNFLENKFGTQNEFKMKTAVFQELKTAVVRFKTRNFQIEIFAQNKPSIQQYAYRHLLAENQILKSKDKDFKNRIIQLKKQGFQTEVAFAKALDLAGNPYEELLKFSPY